MIANVAVSSATPQRQPTKVTRQLPCRLTASAWRWVRVFPLQTAWPRPFFKSISAPNEVFCDLKGHKRFMQHRLCTCLGTRWLSWGDAPHCSTHPPLQAKIIHLIIATLDAKIHTRTAHGTASAVRNVRGFFCVAEAAHRSVRHLAHCWKGSARILSNVAPSV